MTAIVVPKVNNNDATYTLLDWLLPDGGSVEAGEPIAVLESSKAAHELVAEQAGVLHHALAAGTECAVGATIGHLFGTERDRADHLAGQSGDADADADRDLVLTDAAQDLVSRNGVSDQELRSVGRSVIRRTDVEALLAGRARPAPAAARPAEAEAEAERLYQPPRGQLAVAAVVNRSHQSIPAAFTAVRVLTPPPETFRGETRWAAAGPPGVTELVIKAVAGAFARFPVFFAQRRDDDRVFLPRAAHVGVTVDAGAGLYVPVVKHPGDRSIEQIASLLADFRDRARTGGFQDDQLRGANIMVTLHDYTDVEFAVPLVHPGQTCALSIGGPQTEPYLTPSGKLAKRRFFRLGVAYDHRLVNGRDAVLFGREIKAALESPERLQALLS